MNYFNNVAEIEALVSRLIDKLDASRTESLELSVGDVHLKLDRHSAPVPQAPAMMPPPLRMPSVPASPISEEDDVVLPPKEPAPAVSAATINAPLLGVAYAAPAPDAAPFVKVGDSVKKGDIVCIIEAMKVMNEIEADHDGVVTEILFENGKLVEFGQPLIALK
jgi:acetyl-CoA carboxylase biotin carboxyl carrier protein